MSTSAEAAPLLAVHAELLSRVPLFRSLRPAQLGALAAAAEVRRFDRGQAVCTAGRPSPGLVVVKRGRLNRAGAHLGPGQWFDALEALDVRMAQDTATALEETECLVLPARALHDAVRADPELGVALLREGSRVLVMPGEEDISQLLRYATDVREAFREGERRQDALRRSVMGAVRALVALAEAKDPRAAGHGARAARTARALAQALGHDEEQVGHASLGGLLHDVGFLAVDAALLHKGAGALTEAEQAQLRAHPEVGARILENVEMLAPVVPYVLYHHERFDGRGYPQGLTGHGIPPEGRLMAVVEACETLRPRVPAGQDAGRWLAGQLRDGNNRLFDPEMVDKLGELLLHGALDDA